MCEQLLAKVQCWPELCDAAGELGFPAPVGFRRDLAELAAALADDRFRVFVHGDLTPNNVVFTAGGDRWPEASLPPRRFRAFSPES